MTAILKPTNKMFCLLIFLSLFSAYSTKDDNLMLDDILALIVKKFHSYASKSSGDQNTISTDKMYDMVRAEFPTFFGRVKNDELKEIFSNMDDNNDKKVTFEEFMHLLGFMANAIAK
ncbi:protein S100-A6-like [Aquarana catesbeiana]|uniref:protein S100-A6-like n=1 Tax=Aquarana catesbeiana TaxID=8400 RepID=UPI003CC954F8